MMHEDEIQQAAMADLAALDTITQQVRQRESETERELALLQQQYPGLLLDEVLGRTGAERKREARTRIAELEADLQDFPTIYTQLEAERLRVQQRLREADRLAKLRERYEAAKDALLQEYGIGPADELRSLAKALGAESDAEAFLASLTPDTAA